MKKLTDRQQRIISRVVRIIGREYSKGDGTTLYLYPDGYTTIAPNDSKTKIRFFVARAISWWWDIGSGGDGGDWENEKQLIRKSLTKHFQQLNRRREKEYSKRGKRRKPTDDDMFAH